jgi:hypothetical protein
LKFEEVEQVVMVDGIPLYGVPRTSTAEALIRADAASKRRDILGRRWKTISADCRDAVEGCTSGAVASYVPFAVAAVDALDAGHTEAAQALAGSVVDAILSSYFGKDRYKYTPDKKGKRTKDAYDEFNVRQFIAFAPMWQTYQQFFVTGGDKVPTTFSRNATTHTVSRRQFNRRNAVQGLMVACSLLYRVDEGAVALEAETSRLSLLQSALGPSAPRTSPVLILPPDGRASVARDWQAAATLRPSGRSAAYWAEVMRARLSTLAVNAPWSECRQTLRHQSGPAFAQVKLQWFLPCDQHPGLHRLAEPTGRHFPARGASLIRVGG